MERSAARGRHHHARRRARRSLRVAARGEARRSDRGSRDRRSFRGRREGDHASVHRHAGVPQRRRHERRTRADRRRPGGDDERRQLLRWSRWPGGGRMRDHRAGDDGDRLRPSPPAAGCARRAHGGGGARFLDLQLPARFELHGRLRRPAAGAADGRDHGRGGGQDGGGRVVRAALDSAGRAVHGYDLRGAQALEVQAALLPSRQRALPPSHGPYRLLEPADDRLSVRLDVVAGRARVGAAVRALQRPQRAPVHGLDARDDRPRPARDRGQRVSRLCPRDPQVQAPGRDAPAPAAPGRLSDGD